MIEMLKNKVKEANAKYRAGIPMMTDQEYDELIEQLKELMDEGKFNSLISTLNEGAIETNSDGKVKHPCIMGSLEKIKYEEPEVVKSWIKENVRNVMSVSAKVDGISSRASYKGGKLVSLTTRGDGYFGMDITSKAQYIKGLFPNLGKNFNGDIRGELVILKDDFESIKDKYANPRNACAGIMNRKDGDKKFNESELRLISFIPYTILGGEYTKIEQFALLTAFGFNVAKNMVIKKSDIKDDIADVLFNIASEDLPYETDGLVICDETWKNEDKYRPDGCKAFKLNLDVGITTLIGIDWGTPSASGKMTPVGLLERITLAGTNVERVTLNNITWMEKIGIEIGKKVKVLKSGCIIPKVIEVLD